MKISTLAALGTLFMGILAPKLNAQLPETEVWMLTLDNYENIKKVEYLSDFNSGAYNNQAVFADNNNILMTAELDEGNTDIVMLNPISRKWTRLTKTLENEYSPQVSESNYITTVRVEQDGKTQLLWEYPKDASNSGKQFVEEYTNVGYYQSLNNYKMAMFVLEQTNDLHIINLRNNRLEAVTKDIARCLKLKKNGELLFIQNDAKPTIKSFNPISKRIETVHQSLEGSQDFALFGDSEIIIMAKGPHIYRYNPTAASYILLYDLSEYGLKNITRMDYRNGKLLLVNKP